MHGNLRGALALIRHGADVQATDHDGQSPLSFVVNAVDADILIQAVVRRDALGPSTEKNDHAT